MATVDRGSRVAVDVIVTNGLKQGVCIKSGCLVGTLHQIRIVIPINVGKLVEHQSTDRTPDHQSEFRHPPIDLTKCGLTKEQEVR